MTKRNHRMSGALMLVLLSLLGMTLACYSGQVPGLYELTPYYTPTPLTPATDARFGVLEVVLAPVEEGRAFFNLTVNPEPLEDNLVNSKAMCDSPAPAQVLFSGIGADGQIYSLVDCVGSVGWVLEDRLAGPLLFSRDDLAIGLAPAGEQSVRILDPKTYQPSPTNILMQCKPETIVTVLDVQAADPDGDGLKDIFYSISCPTTGGPLTGLVTNLDLFGPVDMNSDARALALNMGDAGLTLTTDPGPAGETATAAGECDPGAVIQASEVRLVDEHVYYRVTCGELAGWVDQDNIVGPLKYDTGSAALVYVPAQPIFADQLSPEQLGEVSTAVEAEPAEGGQGEINPEEGGEIAVDPDIEAADPELHERTVVQYAPPLFLTRDPGPVIFGTDSNVVGQCVNGTVAHISDYAGSDTVYYRVNCDLCVEEDTAEDGNTTCVYEAQEGWAEQAYLQGPVQFVPGDRVTFKSSSAAIEVDATSGIEYARLPATLSGAQSMGRFTEYAGRCTADQPLTVVGVVLDKARTSNAFTFYYRVQCEGEPAVYQTVDKDGKLERIITYLTEDVRAIEGYASVRDLESVE